MTFLGRAWRPTTCDDIYENEGFNHERAEQVEASGLQDLNVYDNTLYIFGYFGSVPLVENRKVRSHLDIL